jgi:hypothetical protein
MLIVGVFNREIFMTERCYVSCGSFVERNIGDVKMFCELWEFCGEKYW